MKFLFFILPMLVFQQICFSQDSIMDFDSNYYRTVTIGRQTWMAQNLNVTHDASGKKIASHCFYRDTNYCKIYGRLYSWESVMNGSELKSTQGICPDGWHVPSDGEWYELIKQAGSINKAGKFLKKDGDSGFNVIMSGNYNPDLDVFNYIDRQAYFWSSTSYNVHAAWMRHFGVNLKNVNRSTVQKHYCFSVRCIKNK